jgi:hypothetical protein
MPASKKPATEKPTGPTSSKIWPRGKIKKSLVTPGMVEKRVRQLARIAGRPARGATKTDREEARRELREPIRPTSRPTDAPFPAGSPWGAPPTTAGRRTPRIQPTDDRIWKELVEEGVDEAAHDQRVRARKAGK